MKDNWERLHAQLDLDTTAVAALVAPLGSGTTVRAATPLAGGLANTLYRVELEEMAEPVVLRLYTRDGAACAKDVALWQLLRGRVPLAALRYADPDGAVMGVPYTISSWVAGQPLAELVRSGTTADAAAALFAAGEVLAEIGRVSFAASGFFGPDLEIVQPLVWTGDALRWFVDDALHTRGGVDAVGPAFADHLLAFVDQQANLLNALPATTALVHADYNPPNLLVARRDEQWAVAAVLDWEFAFAGPPLYDVGVMLRTTHRSPPALADRFVAGYRAGGGALPTDWRRLAKLLDLFNLAEFLAKGQAGSPNVRDVMALIEDTMRGWAGLEDH